MAKAPAISSGKVSAESKVGTSKGWDEQRLGRAKVGTSNGWDQQRLGGFAVKPTGALPGNGEGVMCVCEW